MKSQRRFAPISGRITPESVAVFTRIRIIPKKLQKRAYFIQKMR